jgi:phage FluMu protein Com
MPKLACWSCGRQIYAVAPLDSLFAEERRCPRCGAYLNGERRDTERRTYNRRQNPVEETAPLTQEERRVEERRLARRRKRQDGTAG